MKKPSEEIRVPPSYPASLIYLDESGTVTNDRFYVVGAVKVRDHGAFAGAVRAVRESHKFHEEFRFNRVNRARLPMYAELLETLAGQNLHFAACVVDREVFDPFVRWPQRWEAHANVAAQLLRGCINRREITSVLMDVVTAPKGVSVEEHIRRDVNRRVRNMAIVTAACIDSKTSDGLQVADLFAGAVAFERRRGAGLSGTANSHKARLAEKFREMLNVTSLDGRTPRLNVAVFRRQQSKPPPKKQAGSGPTRRSSPRS